MIFRTKENASNRSVLIKLVLKLGKSITLWLSNVLSSRALKLVSKSIVRH